MKRLLEVVHMLREELEKQPTHTIIIAKVEVIPVLDMVEKYLTELAEEEVWFDDGGPYNGLLLPTTNLGFTALVDTLLADLKQEQDAEDVSFEDFRRQYLELRRKWHEG